mmetsp:Transcript_60494/g.176847  ORF Transcript_60494/g.176847 Transcript_60494/m.176847 type:complete len:351 (-) Transcript_60494:824-1876(-)
MRLLVLPPVSAPEPAGLGAAVGGSRAPGAGDRARPARPLLRREERVDHARGVQSLFAQRVGVPRRLLGLRRWRRHGASSNGAREPGVVEVQQQEHRCLTPALRAEDQPQHQREEAQHPDGDLPAPHPRSPDQAQLAHLRPAILVVFAEVVLVVGVLLGRDAHAEQEPRAEDAKPGLDKGGQERRAGQDLRTQVLLGPEVGQPRLLPGGVEVGLRQAQGVEGARDEVRERDGRVAPAVEPEPEGRVGQEAEGAEHAGQDHAGEGEVPGEGVEVVSRQQHLGPVSRLAAGEHSVREGAHDPVLVQEHPGGRQVPHDQLLLRRGPEGWGHQAPDALQLVLLLLRLLPAALEPG